MLTVEELLEPRYKVVARYPQSNFIVGVNYTAQEACEILNPKNVKGCLAVFDFDKYPAIFRKLEWWEERSIEDMPEYCRMGDYVGKVVRWAKDEPDVYLDFKDDRYKLWHLQPAASEEYNQYTLTTKNKKP